MKTPSLLLAAFFASVSIPSSALFAHELGDSLGTVRFEASGAPAVRDHVIRGVKLVHHMMYLEADHEFAAAAVADPTCAFAYWGRAMTLIHPLWPDSPTEADLKLGSDQIQKGLNCPNATPRERAYLDVLAKYFLRENTTDHGAGLKALDDAWAGLARNYPDDLDAVAFAALYHLAPARFGTKDESRRRQLEAATQLQKILAQIPDHPGALHYRIHALDSPLLADRALEVCDTYGGIAPDVPHALHMPTHIFTRRGMWDKSIEFNRRSADAARQLAVAAGKMNSHYPHALDYLAYAYLQRGQYRAAENVQREILALNGPYSPSSTTPIAYAFAAVPARCALERQAWTEAAALPLRVPAAFPWGANYLNCESIVHFARAIGAARSGNVDTARAEIAALEQLQRELHIASAASYWAVQAETQLLAARAWAQFSPDHSDEALTLMRRAVALEASVDKEAVTPGEVLPAGDLLGDMLLAAGKPSDALTAYEAVLAASPNRLNTLYGAGLAAERVGDAATARRYYQQLATTAADSDTGIGRVNHARAFLASAPATVARR